MIRPTVYKELFIVCQYIIPLCNIIVSPSDQGSKDHSDIQVTRDKVQDTEDGFIRLLRSFQTLIRRLPFNERFEHESERDVGENMQ